MANWEISDTMRLSQSSIVGLTPFNAGNVPINQHAAQAPVKPGLLFGSDTLSLLNKNPRINPHLLKRTPRFSGVFDIRDMDAFNRIAHLIPTIPEVKNDMKWWTLSDGRTMFITGKDAAKARDMEQFEDDEALPDDGAMDAANRHQEALLSNVRPQSDLLDPSKH